MDEADLVRQAKAGDERSFARLIERHRPSLLAYVAGRIPRSLRRKISAEDVLQDTSMTAYVKLAGFDHYEEGAIRAWLGKIAQFKLQEAIRRFAGTAKRGAVNELSRGARRDTEQFAALQATPSEYAMAVELEERVQRALERLPDDYRRVFTLVRVEQRSLREASIQLNRSYEATKKLYGRAVAALARQIHDAPDSGQGSARE